MYRWQWIPLVCFAVAFLATLAVLTIGRNRALGTGRRRELLRDLMRGPGESLRDPMQAAAWDAAEYAALGLFLMPLLFFVFPLKAVYGGELPERATLGAFLAAAALLQGWILWRLWGVLAEARYLTLGYEAEVAVGQELDGLRHLGYRVFHDVPAGEGEAHLDHVVVGPAGVFAVAARGRDAPRGLRGNGGNGEHSWEVSYDGESLQFPGWRETLPLGQAMAQAEWLFEWLSEALGEPVAVRPILVLPGWSVKRTAVSGIPVLAAWRIQAYFERMRPRAEMSDTLIERIAGQLEQRCRVVALVPAGPEEKLRAA